MSLHDPRLVDHGAALDLKIVLALKIGEHVSIWGVISIQMQVVVDELSIFCLPQEVYPIVHSIMRM